MDKTHKPLIIIGIWFEILIIMSVAHNVKVILLKFKTCSIF